MDKLIPVINKLQDVVSVVDSNPLDLPQIVVVGSQSSGKSSVLEAIVGKDFLPRGSGIVTRRPLVLQLAHTKGGKEYGEFLHAPGKKFTNFNEIREEIERDTERISGSNKGVSDNPINLKIYSPNVVNLTLVDLPGLTKVPVGDQPKNIAEQIRKMVLDYIKKPNAVILAVSPANSDLATSDALRIGSEVDPEGKRTIGVLTKLDLMDKGTNCLDVLQGKAYPLRLGFIGVVNRSQQDIIQNKPVSEARAQEEQFFKTHPIYRQVANRCGVNFLSKTLNKILMNHIKECLPELRTKVNTTLTSTRQELAALGDERITTSKGALLLHIINTFVHCYNDTIDGRLSDASATEELYGGARINYIFNDIFGKYLDGIDDLGGLGDDEIQITMTNATGPKASLFIPEESFEQLARRQVRILEEPSFRCVDLVYDELQRIVNCIELMELKRFDTLKDKITDVVNSLLRECKSPAKDMIKNLLLVEVAYINTNHPDFIGGGDAIAIMLQSRAQEQIHSGNGERDIPPEFRDQYRNQLEQEKQKKEREDAARIAREKVAAEKKAQEKKTAGGLFSLFSKQKKDSEHVSPTLEPVPSVVIPKTAKERSANEDFQTQLIETLLKSYFNIVRKNVRDRVPKSIMHFLVNKSKEEIQNTLVKELYKEDLFETLLSERNDISQQREQHKQTIQILTTAQKILSEIVDYKLG